ncbi:hypothetical protein [Gracilimonas amylolytica]|uniref:hypothetical protein n=1 Tax=Gracilimonas amylolytica TaxID=1749045 RepID=UPI000CD95D81|nr:hypothetical protein [Gracilimonas amylolytica]
MSKILLTLFLLLNLSTWISCAQNNVAKDQKLVLETILSDKTLGYIEKGKEYVLIKNDKTDFESGSVIKLSNNTIRVVNNEPEDKLALEFINYEYTDKIIYIELRLFQKNVFYRATYSKTKEDSLQVLLKEFLFIRQE